MSDPSLSLDELRQLARNILVTHNTSDTNATQVAEAITRAEADGQKDMALPEFLIRRPIPDRQSQRTCGAGR